jgi:hypothetical protein
LKKEGSLGSIAIVSHLSHGCAPLRMDDYGCCQYVQWLETILWYFRKNLMLGITAVQVT